MKAKSLLKMLNSCKDDAEVFVIIDGVKTKISQVSYVVADNEVTFTPKSSEPSEVIRYLRLDENDDLGMISFKKPQEMDGRVIVKLTGAVQ